MTGKELKELCGIFAHRYDHLNDPGEETILYRMTIKHRIVKMNDKNWDRAALPENIFDVIFSVKRMKNDVWSVNSSYTFKPWEIVSDYNTWVGLGYNPYKNNLKALDKLKIVISKGRDL